MRVNTETVYPDELRIGDRVVTQGGVRRIADMRRVRLQGALTATHLHLDGRVGWVVDHRYRVRRVV